jgi:hypothetical protein
MERSKRPREYIVCTSGAEALIENRTLIAALKALRHPKTGFPRL